MSLVSRDTDEPVHYGYVSPYRELNVGLWSLFAGASIALGLRLWCKLTRRHGLWYDDYILIVCWTVLLANNSLIIYQFATGYVLENSEQSWDDRMHILINVSSCGTLVGQALTKTAFGVTLLRLSNRWQQCVIWFCISTMNIWMILKVVFQWAKVCGKPSYQNWYRLDFCIGWGFRDDFKEGGNVYNIVMDFVFAAFPWIITRSLEMRRAEKIGLSLTMSLGMIVAIVSAVRVSWKDDGNERDSYYFWRNGISQVWYSSEVAGTIIVQCIPILRPILREIHTSLTSKKLGSTEDGQSTTKGSLPTGKRASTGTVIGGSKRASMASILSGRRASTGSGGGGDAANNKGGGQGISLVEIPEEPADYWSIRLSEFDAEQDSPALTPNQPHRSVMWPLSGSEGSLIGGYDPGKSWDVEQNAQTGLAPPPRRQVQQQQPEETGQPFR